MNDQPALTHAEGRAALKQRLAELDSMPLEERMRDRLIAQAYEMSAKLFDEIAMRRMRR